MSLPPLENSPINLARLRKQSQQDLARILDSVPGRKILILDPELSGQLSLLAQISLLKEHGVEDLRSLSREPLPSDCENVIYIVRPWPKLMLLVAAQIQFDIQSQRQRQYSLFYVPKKQIPADKVLSDEKVYDRITFGEYNMYPLSFDEDVMSLEQEFGFVDVLSDENPTCLQDLARTIHMIQSEFGVIPNIKGKGRAAKELLDTMRFQALEFGIPVTENKSPEIDTLILIDREVDFVTPMCTQLTYEGLIDEFLSINYGSVELDPAIMNSKDNKKTKIALNSSDKLYRDIRGLNFGVVGNVLGDKAATIKQEYTVMKDPNQELSELKKFVKKIHELPEMVRHTDVSQYLLTFISKRSFKNRLVFEQTLVEGQEYDICFEHIEELINKQEPISSTLRLLIILSITHNGIPRKHYEFFKREILQTYGCELEYVLDHLAKSGLFKKQDAKSNWLQIKQALKLIVNDTDDSNPNDIAYVFSGYAPLSVRLVQHALIGGGWRSIEDVLKLLPGPTFEESQKRTVHLADPPTSVDGRRSLVLVVFIGGVTFAEIAALRFLSSQDSMKHDVMVLTSKLINGASLMQRFLESPPERMI